MSSIDDLSGSALERANAIRSSLADTARRMRGMRDAHGINASKLSVLGQLLRAARSLSASELAQRESLQPQSLTRTIADLESEGLITRRQNESDRRQFDIAITPQGAELMARDAARQNDWLAGAMAIRLTPAEQAILVLAAELLDRLAAPNLVKQPERAFQGRVMDDASFRDCSMARSQFEDVGLSSSRFANVDLRGAQFDDVNLAGACVTDANIQGLTILGHDVAALIRRKGGPDDAS